MASTRIQVPRETRDHLAALAAERPRIPALLSLRKESSDMAHSRWKTLRERKLAEGLVEPEDVVEARREIRLSMALAEAVHARRTELGLTQAALADRAGLTQAKISRIEGSDTVPTLPLLAKLARALDASLNIALDDDSTEVTFTAHRSDAA